MATNRPAATDTGGDSPLARAFGAKIDMSNGAQAMCLVVTEGSPLAALNHVGAQPLAQLSATRVIAVVDMTRLSQLQRYPGVLMAGSVSVDPARFARFQQIAGVTA